MGNKISEKYEIIANLKKIKYDLFDCDSLKIEPVLVDFIAYIYNNKILFDRYKERIERYYSKICTAKGKNLFFSLWDYVQNLSKKYNKLPSILIPNQYKHCKSERYLMFFLLEPLCFVKSKQIITNFKKILSDKEWMLFLDPSINLIYDCILCDHFKKTATQEELNKLVSLIDQKNNYFETCVEYMILKKAVNILIK